MSEQYPQGLEHSKASLSSKMMPKALLSVPSPKTPNAVLAFVAATARGAHGFQELFPNFQ